MSINHAIRHKTDEHRRDLSRLLSAAGIAVICCIVGAFLLVGKVEKSTIWALLAFALGLGYLIFFSAMVIIDRLHTPPHDTAQR